MAWATHTERSVSIEAVDGRRLIHQLTGKAATVATAAATSAYPVVLDSALITCPHSTGTDRRTLVRPRTVINTVGPTASNGTSSATT